LLKKKNVKEWIKMPKLKPSDEVLIYSYGGMHYHVKGCWMAPTDMPEKTANYIPVKFGEIKKLRTRDGNKYIPDTCVECYERGLPLPSNPMLGVRRIHPARLKEK
jgi:hypothetical protein